MGIVVALPVGLAQQVLAVLGKHSELGSFGVTDAIPEQPGRDSPVVSVTFGEHDGVSVRRAVAALRRSGFRTIFTSERPCSFYIERCAAGRAACIHCNLDIPAAESKCRDCGELALDDDVALRAGVAGGRR